MRRPRGATLVEVLISLALVIVGLAGLLATLSTSSVASSQSSRLSQAQLRAQTILENIRFAPKAALDCLASTAANNWVTCESTASNSCRMNQTADGGATSVSLSTCIFTATSFSNISAPPIGGTGANNQSLDRTGQAYQLYYNANASQQYRSTFVQNTGAGNRVYDAQVTIAWSDDGTDGGSNPQHFLTLRTGVFP
jgi:type II secretory pathway pseudopilin PulG